MSTYKDAGYPMPPFDLRGRAGTILERWLGFWFAPRDLTTIGAMRICTGLLFTYILLIYCYDLYALLGKDAWVDNDGKQSMMYKLRHEQPMGRPSDKWFDNRAKAPPKDPDELAKWNRYYEDWEIDKGLVFTK